MKQKTNQIVAKFKEEKTNLHPRSLHRMAYDFDKLIQNMPSLKTFVVINDYEQQSIDFFNPNAVIQLNKALLKTYYQINEWSMPANYLCPPIPGRADYIHYVADLLAVDNNGKVPIGEHVKCLDIGTGANCIYPLLAHQIYGWSVVGSDIDPLAINSARKIVNNNLNLKDFIAIRKQPQVNSYFKNIIQPKEFFDVVVCNPPFHSSLKEAQDGTIRKLSHLKKTKITTPILNFGGKNHELWCEGGETQFVKKMIEESVAYKSQVNWFSCLISKEKNLNFIYQNFKKLEPIEFKTIEMGQGNKKSRIVAWSFTKRNNK
ncbi:MAG: 23S rRNA (adenine(1618)-N(6))-methyltransferase RlmF [Bacteroidota bacterium]|nr:23S rRNA (adenine(1618)-N(6))-methyltransferase RlmF [Bacteroidota bacterium]